MLHIYRVGYLQVLEFDTEEIAIQGEHHNYADAHPVRPEQFIALTERYTPKPFSNHSYSLQINNIYYLR